MKTARTIGCVLLLMIASVAVAAETPSQQNTKLAASFLSGLEAYQKGAFEDAIAKFKRVADAGVQNGKLYYNLGNAYMKNGDLGHAILWYERALKLIPADPDLKFNLDYARGLVKDKMETQPAPLLRVLFFWNHLLSPLDIQRIAIGLNILFALSLTLHLFIKKPVLKALAGAALLFTLIFSATAFFNSYAAHYQRHAVVLPDEINVRSGLTPESTSLFVLHAGAKVKIEKEKPDHYRVYFAPDKIGWAPKSQLGAIEVQTDA